MNDIFSTDPSLLPSNPLGLVGSLHHSVDRRFSIEKKYKHYSRFTYKKYTETTITPLVTWLFTRVIRSAMTGTRLDSSSSVTLFDSAILINRWSFVRVSTSLDVLEDIIIDEYFCTVEPLWFNTEGCEHPDTVRLLPCNIRNAFINSLRDHKYYWRKWHIVSCMLIFFSVFVHTVSEYVGNVDIIVLISSSFCGSRIFIFSRFAITFDDLQVAGLGFGCCGVDGCCSGEVFRELPTPLLPLVYVEAIKMYRSNRPLSEKNKLKNFHSVAEWKRISHRLTRMSAIFLKSLLSIRRLNELSLIRI